MTFKIISGGQNGADKAALETAWLFDIETGGMAPQGWRVCDEDGNDTVDKSLKLLGLKEAPSSHYSYRTIENVKTSDGTVIFGKMSSPGSQMTVNACIGVAKPYKTNPNPEELVAWMTLHGVDTLNIAGNREYVTPGISRSVLVILFKVFMQMGYQPNADKLPIIIEKYDVALDKLMSTQMVLF